MNFEIRKDIPIPGSRKKESKWPFAKMVVGDCIEVKDKKIQPRAQSYAHVYGAESKKKFMTRTQDGVLRIWRIK